MVGLSVLVGGGRDETQVRALLAPFVAALAGGEAACVVVDDGEGVDLDRWRGVLADAAAVRTVVLEEGRPLIAEDVAGSAGVFVAGGLTPLYAELVVPARAALAALPYAGFSAGAAIAAERAIVGGWTYDARQVAPEDAGEDLDDLTVVAGLGRVDFAVDVHAAQWGTLQRAVAAVRAGLVTQARAIDEHTAVVVRDGVVEVVGAGSALQVRPAEGGVLVS
ncbi:peptidase S51 [Nocardioides sp. SLBN-35]|uniref:peptidase S51 n=1 Tax=Nocardioides sp. SLBN-35 TaxID=2768445 RepID=UPI001150EE2F|nr:peptidase S51 [Nocardioides sp. SLBN-35]TQK69117.1 cyanophycinase [Nocardioides sp. SLBN-35]